MFKKSFRQIMSILLVGIWVIAVVCGGSVCFYNSLISSQMNRHIDSKNRDQMSGIMEGAESVFLKGNSKKAVLMIHGFIGSPRDFADFPRTLHQKGYTVSAPLLPGHGTRPSDFAKTSPEELETFVLNHYRELKKNYDEVNVVGFSMGGSLAILLTQHENVDRLVLAAPFLKIAHQWYYILPTEFYQALFSDFIPYVYRPSMFKQVNKREAVSQIVDYAYVPLKGAGTAIVLGRKASQVSNSIQCPTLILHSKGDQATDYRESARLGRALEKKVIGRFVDLPNSNHMIFLDYDASIVEQEILGFIESFAIIG